MNETPLDHINERLGHVAVDMGLMRREQVADTQRQIMLVEAGDSAAGFGRAAVELGYLSREEADSLEREELRRRRQIGGYEIIDRIGVGSVATVYRAVQLAMDREVALKVLHPGLASDPVFVLAYIAEARAVSRFHHPHIVQGFDAGESNGFYYFAHEYLSGGSMAGRLAENGPAFSENRLLMYLRQTAAALRHAWEVAVYHGDINPGNLLLNDQGNIKLANLGVPRVADTRDGGTRGPIAGFVRCGPEYAAPEQLDKPDMVNARTDIYSLGATFYHISFAAPPFPGNGREQLLAARKAAPMPSFSLKSQEAFSGKYLRLIHDMLQVDPEKRPANPDELEDRLEKFHTGADSEPDGSARQAAAVPALSGVSGRSRRPSPRVAAPNPHGMERRFSLKPRLGRRRSGAFGWMLAILSLMAVILAIGLAVSR